MMTSTKTKKLTEEDKKKIEEEKAEQAKKD